MSFFGQVNDEKRPPVIREAVFSVFYKDFSVSLNLHAF
jgi:hypothetical protein